MPEGNKEDLNKKPVFVIYPEALNFINLWESYGNDVSENTINNNMKYGIYLEKSDDNIVVSNTFNNNR